ncbi:uncharacterized protein KY384_003403 [Bacidia gigantensis]|uniref:uncharacterized protein n=1 Tax=Bacidia gigantensis TaxID=2732470 RepID=UPI001D04CE89|nr:uncharacterized protein KY384_003403 [Bacidia gigantensis]KAG8531767.1 hypothetical protein KY384_003403 [Bacidia gigantensis]
MRPTVRLFAAVKAGAGRYLEPGNPTGLTGLFTHPSPRSTLLYLYHSTLDKLQSFPDHSVYRQSAEALTNHRKRIIEEIKPAGLEEWQQRAKEKIEEYPHLFRQGESQHVYQEAGKVGFVETKEVPTEFGGEPLEWDGEKGQPSREGGHDEDGRSYNARELMRKQEDTTTVEWEPEPSLDAAQIDDAEQKIGAGLIEEVIQVAEGELKLADTMLEHKVWEDLEEKPLPEQWQYFSRDQHTRGTQEPPK